MTSKNFNRMGRHSCPLHFQTFDVAVGLVEEAVVVVVEVKAVPEADDEGAPFVESGRVSLMG